MGVNKTGQIGVIKCFVGWKVDIKIKSGIIKQEYKHTFGWLRIGWKDEQWFILFTFIQPKAGLSVAVGYKNSTVISIAVKQMI